MIFLLESFLACAFFTLFVFLMSRDPMKTIFNYRCGALTAYALWCVVDWFHIKGSLVGMVLAIPAALIAGIIVIL